MRDQKVHGNVLAVYVLVHHVPDGLGHHVGVQIGVVLQKTQRHRETCNVYSYYTAKRLIWWDEVSGGARSDLMEEGSSCQDHGEFTGIVGVVKPGLMVDVPRMIPPRETHDAISCLTPHSMTQHQT